MDIAKTLLPDLLAWGRDVKGFKPGHAISALHVVKFCQDGIKDKDGHVIRGLGMFNLKVIFAFALTLTIIFWLDDCFDEQILAPDELDVVGAAIVGKDKGTTPEACGCLALQRLQADLACAEEDARLMFDCWADVFISSQKEALLSQAKIEMSYAEYLDNGIKSISVSYILATVSALADLCMASRYKTPHFQRFLRHFCVVMRIQNDLNSLEKDRRERCRANAVLVVEHLFPGVDGRSFVEADLRGYERLLAQDIACLHKDDPLRRTAEILIAMQEQYYKMDRRYASG